LVAKRGVSHRSRSRKQIAQPDSSASFFSCLQLAISLFGGFERRVGMPVGASCIAISEARRRRRRRRR